VKAWFKEKLALFATWLYVEAVIVPQVTKGSTIKITIMDEQECDAYLEECKNAEWKQNKKNEGRAMYEKRFDTEQ